MSKTGLAVNLVDATSGDQIDLATASSDLTDAATALSSSASDLTTAAAAYGGAQEYETVAASQTAQVLGSTGAIGDQLTRVIIVPASVSPGNVLVLDNATSITLFAGGTNSLTELKPVVVEVGMLSVSGAWKITTGANVSVIAVGNFT